MGLGRSSYYDRRTVLEKRDAKAIEQLRAVHDEHPFYGVERLALHLHWSQGKTRRTRNLAGLVIPTATKKNKYSRGKKPEIEAPDNALKPFAVFKDPDRPQDGLDYSGMVNADAWVQDFTYMKFQGTYCYLAVVLCIKTRRVLGWRLGTNHSSELTYSAFLDALSKYSPPAILHSDQGSEYLSYKHQLLCQRMEIILSCSDKASPWQNGFMERWFGNFKLELKPLSQLKDLSELHETIALQIHYYNTKRIHSVLKTNPSDYAKSLEEQKVIRNVSEKVRG